MGAIGEGICGVPQTELVRGTAELSTGPKHSPPLGARGTRDVNLGQV